MMAWMLMELFTTHAGLVPVLFFLLGVGSETCSWILHSLFWWLLVLPPPLPIVP